MKFYIMDMFVLQMAIYKVYEKTYLLIYKHSTIYTFRLSNITQKCHKCNI